MALYTRDSIERLRDTVDMAELVGSKTDLRRVGSRLPDCAHSTTSVRRRSP